MPVKFMPLWGKTDPVKVLLPRLLLDTHPIELHQEIYSLMENQFLRSSLKKDRKKEFF